MLRVIFRFLTCCFFAVGCRAPVRAGLAEVDESKITDEIQESKIRKPYFIASGDTGAFRDAYRSRFGVEPVFTARKGNVTVVLLNNDEDKESSLTVFKPRSVGKYPPFIYFDETYEERLQRGFLTIDDLMAGYKDPMLNEALLAGVVQANPRYTKLHIIGTTAFGRNILALELTDFRAQGKKIPLLFSGAMHGNELTATEHCYHIISEILRNIGQYETQLGRVSLWIVPIVNPDGNYLFWHHSGLMGRKNAVAGPGQNQDSPMRGVDLNRNFPFKWNSGHKKASSEDPNSVYYRGASPGSEKETRAMMQLAGRERFLYSISFHAVSGKILVPYTIENVRNPAPDYAMAFARGIGPKIRHHNPKRGFRVVKNIYPVDGTDQDYYYFKYGTIAYIVESSYRNCEYRYVPYYLEGYKPLWEAVISDYETNLKFVLRVTNKSGEPVEATIRFSDQAFYEGESRATNPADGFFIRLTKNSLPVEVTVSAPGYVTQHLDLAPQGVGYPDFTPVILDSN